MRKSRVLYSLLLAVVLTGPQKNVCAQGTDGKVTYTMKTLNYNGTYDPDNCAVVWVVDGSGKFVKTLCRHAANRMQYLYKWIADRGSYTNVDGVTSATFTVAPEQPQTHTVVWNCRGTNGQVAADGAYVFRGEYTSSNAQGPYMSNGCVFVKGPTAVTTNFATFINATGVFTNMSLTYTPYAETAVTNLTPASGLIDSSLPVVVTVTNQTLNPLSFSVALSNLTAGAHIGTQPVSALAGLAVTNIVFSWSTVGLTPGAYQLRAASSVLATETNTANNLLTRAITLDAPEANDIAVTSLTPAAGLVGSQVNLQVTVTNKASNATGPFILTLTNLTTATSLTSFSNAWRVAASADDAEESVSTHAVSLTSSALELVVSATNQIVGIRFAALPIPAGATITTAAIQFVGRTNSTLNLNPIALTIKGQAADNAPVFTTATSGISTRPDTAAAVDWSPPDWENGETGLSARTPELNSVVQEIVWRPGWSAGNALAFKITGIGSRRAWPYDGSTSNAPQLIMQWTTASALIATQQVASLAPYAVTNLTFVWSTASITAGVYQVCAQAGPVTTETYFADNSLTTAIALREPNRDLAVTAVILGSIVPPGIVTNVTVTITNRGDLAEAFTHTLRDLTAASNVVSTLAVTSLAANASTNLVLAWDTTTNAIFKLGFHTLQAVAGVLAGETSTADNTNSITVAVASGMATNALVARGSMWKYLDQGLDISRAPWHTTDYYDGFWSSGISPLGYGLSHIATPIGYGAPSNRYVTTYFRREFTMEFAPTTATGRMTRAHGAVLYLNGSEIARQNMPPGPAAYGTLADTSVTGAEATNYFDFAVPPGALAVGRNLLAAELHLAAVTNTTAGFAVELLSVNPDIPSAFRPGSLGTAA